MLLTFPGDVRTLMRGIKGKLSLIAFEVVLCRFDRFNILAWIEFESAEIFLFKPD